MDESQTGCYSDSEAGPEVLSLFERYAYGSDSMSTSAGELNAKGFRTNGRSRYPDTGDGDESKGRGFTNWSLRDILENQFYVGKVRHKDEYFDGLHQSLISQLLFDEVQKRKTQNPEPLPEVGQLSPNPPKRWSLALTPWMMGKGRRKG